jgi:hypothetical protein
MLLKILSNLSSALEKQREEAVIQAVTDCYTILRLVLYRKHMCLLLQSGLRVSQFVFHDFKIIIFCLLQLQGVTQRQNGKAIPLQA